MIQIALNANDYPSSNLKKFQAQSTIPNVAMQATNVCISEINATGGSYEWIEIYNPTGSPVDLQNWVVRDGDWSIEVSPMPSYILNPGAAMIVGDAAANPDITDTITLTDTGDDLVLIDNLGVIQDVLVFGSGSGINSSLENTWYWQSGSTAPAPTTGQSIQRVNRSISGPLEDNNLPSDWEIISPPTPRSLPQFLFPAELGDILISEVMYAGTGGEWIELVNNGSNNINIGGCSLTALSKGNTTILPDGIYLSPYATILVSDLELADAGDVLELRNQTGTILDITCWGSGNDTFVINADNGWISQINASGNLLSGQSIFRYNLTRNTLSDTNSSLDWYVTNNPTPNSFYTINVEDVLFSEIGMSETYEFIELYNNLSWPMTLDGMEIWDYGASSLEIAFQGNVTIPSRGVLTAGDSGGGYNYVAAITLGNAAEDLVLYRDGTKTYELDVIIYGNDLSGNKYPWGPGSGWIGPTNASGGLSGGTTLQRVNGSSLQLVDTNTSMDWVAAPRTNGSLPNYIPPALANIVLITEVMFAPSTPSTGAEYIELYNTLDVPVDISNWQIYRGQKWGISAEITFPINTVIPARTHFSVLDDNAVCGARYNVTGLNYSHSFTLDDGPGDAILADGYNNVIDFVAWRTTSVNYTNSVDLIAWTDYGVYKGSAGKALARLYNPALNDAYVDTNSSVDWRYGVYPAPGNHTNATIFLSTPFTGTAQVRTFSSPDNTYAAVVDLWRTAQTTIDVCVYQFTSDPLLQELIAAMNRGVHVRLLLQDIYPLYDSPYIFDSTHDPDNYQTVYVGTQVYNNPNGSVRWASSYYAYTHAKYFIIDGEVIGILTENYKSTGVPSNPTYGNRGWGIAINNSQLAQKYLQIYNFDWSIAQVFNPSILITGQRDTIVPTGVYKPFGSYKTVLVTAQFQTVVAFDDPINAIVGLLDKAKTCIYIELFYLYPTWTDTPGGQNNNPLLQALIRAAQRGVEVRIILDSTSYNYDTTNDNDDAAQVMRSHGITVKYSNNSGGIVLFHVKALTVDNSTVMIASLNWNENSATNNREIGIIVNSTEVTQYYVDLFLYDWGSYSTTVAPGGTEPSPEPTYTWMWWLPVTLLVYVIVLLFGYIHRLMVEGTRGRNIPHVFSPSLKESIKPTTQAQKGSIHIELAILRLKIQEIYGSAITVMQLKPYGTSTGDNAPGTFIRSYVRANHEFLQVGAVVNPTPYTLIFKYSPEDYIGIESTLDLRPRAFEIQSLLTSSVRETVRLERIKARVDNMLREGN